ncbi:MAG: hypothetical protein ACM3PF_09180 [Bacteroidota bacterium]
MSRFPIVFAQTVAFAAATGSITWQILRFRMLRGTSLDPFAIALWISAAFVAGAMLYAAGIAPLQAHLDTRARLRGAPWSRSLLLLQTGIASVWTLAWAFPGMQFIGMGGSDVFYGVICFMMGGMSGAIFWMGLGRTPV